MEVGVRLIGVFLRLLNFILAPFFWLAGRGKDGAVPHTDNPILFYSVQELADKIRKGELTSEKVVTTYIDRVKEVNPYINAVVDERYSAALDEARECDRILEGIRESGKWSQLDDKPLFGVPFTVKESCSLSGMSNAVGCIEYANRKATSDGGAVQAIRRAGAIPLLVSNTPELCLGWETSNLLHGVTNNPYCFNRTPGGSSGGESALIASAASPFGVVSDIAGSIRVPAAFCGIFGHKPTPGLVPISGHIPWVEEPLFGRLLCTGPACRYAKDLKLLMKVLSGKDLGEANVKDMKIFFMTEVLKSIAIIDTEKCIKDKIVQAVEHLRGCGAVISDKKFKAMEDSVEISISVFFSMKDIPNMMQDPTNPKKEKSILMELLKNIFGGSNRSLQSLGFALINRTKLFIPESRRQYYHDKAKKLREEIIRELGTNGVLLLPVFNARAHRHGAVFVRAAGVAYTMLHNVLRLPAASVPVGLHDSLPVAIQVIAAPNQDRLCLAVAEELEKAFGGWRPPS